MQMSCKVSGSIDVVVRICDDLCHLQWLFGPLSTDILRLPFFLSRQCPMHNASYSILRRGQSLPELVRRRYAKETPETEYAFEMACSNIRYGPGVTQEVGMVSQV